MQARRVFVSLLLVAACTAREAAPPVAKPAPSPPPPVAAAKAPPLPVLPSPPAALDACKLSPGGAQRSSTAKPFFTEIGECFGNQMCDVADVPPKGAGACFVATTNIARAEVDARANRRGAIASSTVWDREHAPKYFDRVDAHLRFSDTESALLRKNGFVVLEREGHDSYATAYHRIFQEQLPVYVSADSILEAVYHANEILLLEVEKTKLGPRLVRMIDRMRATLERSKKIYDAETYEDLDLYLAVPERLLRGDTGVPVFADASAIAQQAEQGSELTEVTMFGRARMVDFTQYTPRGHYASYQEAFEIGDRHYPLASYFRAMTWLSRLEFNLVSRSCRSSQPGALVDPSETPREARDAIALADLAARSGALDDVRAFESVYATFAGKREDVSPIDLAAMGIAPRDADAPAKLRARIGDGWKRTANMHWQPDGTKELPAIATLFGERVVPDIAPLEGVVHPHVSNRLSLGAADVGYVLGHDRALVHLKGDLGEHPSLHEALEKGRRDLAAKTRGRSDVYGLWLDAVTKLGARPEGRVPSFMKTDAYADAKLASAVAAYSQIRHTFVLLSGQGYDMYGCEIPDGFVEPAVATYEALLGWARAARAIAPQRAAYFDRVKAILTMLIDVSRAELDGRALTEPQRRWLGMVSEKTPENGFGGDSSVPAKYTGWYFDLFPDREIGANRDVAVVADYFTLTNAGEVRYVGVRGTALGAFIVDAFGEPRAMVGPVTLSYETATPIDQRLNDEVAKKLEPSAMRAPWNASYVAPKPASSLAVRTDYQVCASDGRVVVTADEAAPVTITLLDHHGDAIAPSLTLPVKAGAPSVFAFELPKAVLESRFGVEGLEVKVGAAREARGVAVNAPSSLTSLFDP
jgi:hypothetical protein